MILDTLENAYRYTGIHKGFAEAIEFLMRPDLKEIPVGSYEIDGDRVYAIVAREQGNSREDEQLEVHKRYIDIQLVLSGTDEMGWKPGSSCKHPSTAYDQMADIQYFADEPDAWVPVRSGTFAVFFPEDAHQPLVSTETIHKVVVKVAVNPG